MFDVAAAVSIYPALPALRWHVIVNRAAYDGIQAPNWSDTAPVIAQQQQLQQIKQIDDFLIYVWND